MSKRSEAYGRYIARRGDLKRRSVVKDRTALEQEQSDYVRWYRPPQPEASR